MFDEVAQKFNSLVLCRYIRAVEISRQALLQRAGEPLKYTELLLLTKWFKIYGRADFISTTNTCKEQRIRN